MAQSVAPRLRVLDLGTDQFPDWWPAAAVASAFTLVARGADVVVGALPRPWWTAEDFDRAGDQLAGPRRPTAVYLPFDSWDDPSRGWQGAPEWGEHVRRYAAVADVVAGPQLPARGGPLRSLPMPYPPLVERRRARPDLTESTVDLAFAGFHLDPGWAAPPRDPRDRRHRGHLVARLRDGLPADRLLIRNARYWDEDADRDDLARRATRELDASIIGFAPAGYGHLTFRHADIWARGRVLLTAPVHHEVLVPEPRRWEAGEIGLVYAPDGSDIVEVVEDALGAPRRLQDVARAGWEYGQRWTVPERQVAALAAALRG